VTVDAGFGDFTSFVGGIVENLNVEEFTRIIEARDGFDQAFDHVTFIEDRELDGDAWPLLDWRWRAGNVLSVLVIIVDEPIAMEAVAGEDGEDDEIGNHHREVEGVGAINASEGTVGKLVPIAAHAALGKKEKSIE
jgi:hypothetical protein